VTPNSLLGRGVLAALRRLLQAGLVGLVAYGILVGNGGLSANAILALGVTAVPDLLRWRWDFDMDERLALWIAIAAAFHSAGSLGAYGAQRGILTWYDQIAHVISASFVAGVGYAVVDALDRSSDTVSFPREFRFVFTLAFILAFGVAWEIAEFGSGALTSSLTGTEILVQYGVSDVVSDLTFNTLAAAVVVLWGTDYFRGVSATLSRRVFDDRS
jgi:hypothetical protein